MTDFSANSTFSRYNIRANVDLDITDRLFASAKLGFTVEDKSSHKGNNKTKKLAP